MVRDEDHLVLYAFPSRNSTTCIFVQLCAEVMQDPISPRGNCLLLSGTGLWLFKLICPSTATVFAYRVQSKLRGKTWGDDSEAITCLINFRFGASCSWHHSCPRQSQSLSKLHISQFLNSSTASHQTHNKMLDRVDSPKSILTFNPIPHFYVISHSHINRWARHAKPRSSHMSNTISVLFSFLALVASRGMSSGGVGLLYRTYCNSTRLALMV